MADRSSFLRHLAAHPAAHSLALLMLGHARLTLERFRMLVRLSSLDGACFSRLINRPICYYVSRNPRHRSIKELDAGLGQDGCRQVRHLEQQPMGFL